MQNRLKAKKNNETRGKAPGRSNKNKDAEGARLPKLVEKPRNIRRYQSLTSTSKLLSPL
jgi:hypothetical protein